MLGDKKIASSLRVKEDEKEYDFPEHTIEGTYLSGYESYLLRVKNNTAKVYFQEITWASVTTGTSF